MNDVILDLQRNEMPFSVRWEPDRAVWFAQVGEDNDFITGYGQSSESLTKALEAAWADWKSTTDDVTPRGAGL
jgi:hypothetical protein